MIKQCCIVAGLLVLTACSEEPTAGQTQRLQAQIQELNQQLRQYRAEVQRSNERVVAMLQAHGLQSDSRTPAIQADSDIAHAGHDRGGTGSSPAGAPIANSDVGAALHKSHASMDQQMMSVPMTGDPDRDFLAMMIRHHQGAIDMARVIIEGGKRPEVRKFAEDIIAHQQAEIDLMKRWIETSPK